MSEKLRQPKKFGIPGDLVRHVKKGRVRYDAVPLPENLNEYRKDLYAGASGCRRLLESGKLAEARERLESIERLVKDMEDRADPDRRRGQAVLAGSHGGGESKDGRVKADTPEIIAFVEDGHSYAEAARKFKLKRYAVARRVQRHRRKKAGA